jgi:hypothetical protein
VVTGMKAGVEKVVTGAATVDGAKNVVVTGA